MRHLKINTSKSTLENDFRKLYSFLETKFNDEFCLDIICEKHKGDMYEYSDAMCIRIYKDNLNAMIKLFDPSYLSSEKGGIIIEVIKNDNDFNEIRKELPLMRLQEDSFFNLVEKIADFKLLYPNLLEEDDYTTVEKKESDIDKKNNELIAQFETWVNEL